MKVGVTRSPSVSAAGTRQTVLSGSVDSNGFPNALSIGSGLAVTLTATGTPFELSGAAGFGGGCLDWCPTLTANQSFTGLTASATCFLYIDRNTATGILTTGFSVLAPIYATIAPSSPATDQHWFDFSTFTMKRWSGSAWIVLQRIFVGECSTGASTVANTITYAYRGFYQSAWVAVVGSTPYNFAHNLGIPPAAANASFGVWTSTTGLDNAAILGSPTFSVGSAYYGYLVQNLAGAIRNNFRLTTQAYVVVDANGAWQTTGFYSLRGSRGF